MGKTLVKNSDILSGICRLKLKDNEEWSNVCKESIFLNAAGSFWLLIMSRHCVCVCVCPVTSIVSYSLWPYGL